MRQTKQIRHGVEHKHNFFKIGRFLSRNYVMGWLQLVGSIKLKVSFAKKPYKRDYILQKRPIIQSILLTVANFFWSRNYVTDDFWKHENNHMNQRQNKK